MHGKPPERLFVREIRSILLWGAALPLAILALAWPTRGASFALLCCYLILYWRLRRYAAHRGWTPSDAQLYARWCILSKFPMLIGLMRCWFDRIAHRPKQLIEYKGPERTDPHGIPCSSTSGK
jgi:hypothetical protein